MGRIVCARQNKPLPIRQRYENKAYDLVLTPIWCTFRKQRCKARKPCGWIPVTCLWQNRYCNQLSVIYLLVGTTLRSNMTARLQQML